MRTRTDTVYKTRTDSVPKVVTVTKSVFPVMMTNWKCVRSLLLLMHKLVLAG